MSAMLAALAVACFVGIGIYLVLSSQLQLVILGFLSISNGIYLAVMTASIDIENTQVPITSKAMANSMADPLPQAFILTALVIGLGSSAFLAAFSMRHDEETGETNEQIRRSP